MSTFDPIWSEDNDPAVLARKLAEARAALRDYQRCLNIADLYDVEKRHAATIKAAREAK